MRAIARGPLAFPNFRSDSVSTKSGPTLPMKHECACTPPSWSLERSSPAVVARNRLRDKYGCTHSGQARSRFRKSRSRPARSNRTSPFREAEKRTTAAGETGYSRCHSRRRTPSQKGKCPRRRVTRRSGIRRQGRDRSGTAHRSRPRKRALLRPSRWHHWPLLSRQHRLLLGCSRYPRRRLAFQQVFLSPLRCTRARTL